MAQVRMIERWRMGEERERAVRREAAQLRRQLVRRVRTASDMARVAPYYQAVLAVRESRPDDLVRCLEILDGPPSPRWGRTGRAATPVAGAPVAAAGVPVVAAIEPVPGAMAPVPASPACLTGKHGKKRIAPKSKKGLTGRRR